MTDDLDELLNDLDATDAGIRQQALDQFKVAFGKDATLLDACLDLRMACNGSGDPLSPEDVAQKVAALHARLGAWYPSVCTKWAAFDTAVYQLVVATLQEVMPEPEENPSALTEGAEG